MDIHKYMANAAEKPLDHIVDDGGFCAIFRTIGCVGDSLASGEFESLDETGKKDYHDRFEYSWGQYIARMCGNKVYNFSRGGMTAKEYCESFAEHENFWNVEKRCQCYIIALGTNDIHQHLIEGSSATDIDLQDYRRNKKTFAGYYGQIIQRLKENQPKAKFFLNTLPRYPDNPENELQDFHRKLLYDIAALFDNTYVLDLRRYSPVRDAEYSRYFSLGGHMNPMGYLMDAKMIVSYIDYIIRNNPEDFAQVGFIGTPWHNSGAKW